MAEADSLPVDKTIYISSDHVPQHYCEPCFEVTAAVKPVAGYCQNCEQDLCFDCFSTHLLRKPFRSHKLVKLMDKSTRPKTKQAPHIKPQKLVVECLQHHGERLLSFCHSHSQCCCKVCLTINHQACHTDEISKLTKNIKDSKELKNLNKNLNTLKKGFNDILSKTDANDAIIQKNHRDAIKAMKSIQVVFDNLMAKTEAQADKVMDKDSKKIEKVSASCEIVIEQINKLTDNLDILNGNGETEGLFISMKCAESQLKSLEEKLDKLDMDNTVRTYKLEPDDKLKTLLNDLNVLGQLSFEISQPQYSKTNSLLCQKAKTPKYVKDIKVLSNLEKKCDLIGHVLLPNKEILITDWDNKKVKLLDTNQEKIISEIKVSGNPFDATKVKEEIAVTVNNPNKIQFVSVSQRSLSQGREIPVKGSCKGIAYNAKDQTLIVTYIRLGSIRQGQSKIEIINMEGNVIKCLNNDSQISKPISVAISPNMTDIYMTDRDTKTVMSMTLNGEFTTVYTCKGNHLQCTRGLCVHSSGLVYVVGRNSDTVHQLDPRSGEFKVLLEKKDGLKCPRTISYCELEDKMYIGMKDTFALKVFQMK